MNPRRMRSICSACALVACTVAAWAEPVDLSARVESLRDKLDVPALEVVLFDADQVTARGLAGVRKLGEPAPVTFDDRFHLGSLSKSMTATLAADLVEDGVIEWTSTIEDVCPQQAALIPEQYRTVTLEQLCTHRAGLPDDRHMIPIYVGLWMHGGTPEQTRTDALVSSFKLPGLTDPGEQMTYSNSGYMCVGHLLEVAAGKPYEELMAERLFRPLKMTHAGFGEPVETYGDAEPRGHVRSDDGDLKPAPTGPQGALPPAMDPAGGVHCSVLELATFVQQHLAGLRGKDGVVSAKSFKKLHADPEGDHYALGWALDDHDPDAVVSDHSGSNGRWFAVMMVDPAHNRGYVGVMNAVPPDPGEAFRGIKAMFEEDGE